MAENHGPLEFPLGAIDELSDYFFFEIPTKSPVALATLAASTPAHLTAHVLANSIVLEDRASGQGAARVGQFDGGLFVRPYWSDLPFSTLAREVLGAVDRVSAAVGVQARYFGNELGPELRTRIDDASRRHGAEYVEKMGLLPCVE